MRTHDRNLCVVKLAARRDCINNAELVRLAGSPGQPDLWDLQKDGDMHRRAIIAAA